MGSEGSASRGRKSRRQTGSAPARSKSPRTVRQETAGGRASSEGTKFHASVATVVYVSILAKTPLSWFGPSARLPIAVSAESGGGGDDLQIEFGPASVAEVQARHQMNAGRKFTDFVAAIVDRTRGKTPSPVALVAGRHTTSTVVFAGIAKDLDGLRAGVDVARLAPPISTMLVDPEKRGALEQLFVVDVDFDRSPSPERENALEKLRRRLVDESRAEEAWAVLFEDAVDLCATGSRRAEADLVDRLLAKGIRLKETTPDDAARAELESIRTTQLEEQYLDLAAASLKRVLSELESRGGGAKMRAEALRLLAHVLMAQKRTDEAREAARRATEVDPDSSETHATYARALLAAGEPVLAGDQAEAALAVDPNSRRGWIAKLHVAEELGQEPGDPPARLFDDPLFRADLAAFNANRGRWREVRELTEPLLAAPEPSTNVRFFHAVSLAAAGYEDPSDKAVLRRAETDLSALISDLRHDHPLLAQSYYNRAILRRQLGDEEGAAADDEQVRRVNRDLPELAEQTAVARISRGDLAGALAVLETSIVPFSPSLLALRADLRIQAGKLDEGRRDLDDAAKALPLAPDPDHLAYQLGEVAVGLGDLERAQAFYELMSQDARGKTDGYVLAGVIAFAADNIDRGREAYQAAIGTQTENEKANFLRLRLAMSLRDAKLPVEALALLKEVGLENIPDGGYRVFVVTAFDAGDYVLSRRALDVMAEKGPLPRWALAVRADIGLRSADPEAVIADLSALEAQGEATARIALTLARCLIEIGRMEEARARVRAAISGPITPRERLEAGIYLKRLHHPNDAVDQLFRAYREDRNDPDIQRAFASMVMVGGADLQPPATIEAGSHVRLKRAGGATREHSIFAEGVIEKALGDLLVGEAGDLIGHAVGETIERERPPLAAEKWNVEEVVRAEVHAARTIVQTFRDNFPNEPFFVMAVHVGDLDKVEDWAELLTMLGNRRDVVVKLLELYHRLNLPLEWLSDAIGASIPELMNGAQTPGVAPLFVEWTDAESYGKAAQAASDAKTLILTRSALFTARRQQLFDVLSKAYELVAPTSLEWQLREELETAEATVLSGHSTMMSGPAGIALVELKPNDPALVSARDDAAETLAWLLANVRRLPRPLESLGQRAGDDPELDRDAIRDQVGPASFDAAALTEHGVGILYADDLGLRRHVARGPTLPAGISTVTLVEGLVEQAVLTPRDRGRIHADLVLAGYAFIPPSADLMSEAIRRMPGLGIAQFRTLFETLSLRLSDVPLTANLIATVLRHTATQTIARATLEQVTEAAVLGLAKKLLRPNAVRIVRLLAQRELRLLPHHLASVEKVCDRLTAEEPPAAS